MLAIAIVHVARPKGRALRCGPQTLQLCPCGQTSLHHWLWMHGQPATSLANCMRRRACTASALSSDRHKFSASIITAFAHARPHNPDLLDCCEFVHAR